MFHQGTFLLCVTTIVLKNTIAKSPLSKMGIRNGNLELLGWVDSQFLGSILDT